jgi:hypothetical protein
MMINCKESAVRSSELRDQKLKGIRKLELWYHLMICRFCRIYDRQIKKLGRVSRLIGESSCGLTDGPDQKSHIKLSDGAKSRMKKNLHV